MSKLVQYITRGSKKRKTTTGESTSRPSPSDHSTSSHHSTHSQRTARSYDSPTEEESNTRQSIPLENQPEGDTLGIVFTDEDDVETFFKINNKLVFNTKFYKMGEMQTLGVHAGVYTLFKNIGWEGFLKWDEVGYRRPTLEFISSCRLSDNKLFFRSYNRDYHITSNELSNLAGAPNENTIKMFTRPYPNFDFSAFWLEITGSSDYVPGKLKTSLIIHPVLRVAARILICTFYGSEEAGSINNLELFHLSDMVTQKPPLPNFGSFLLHALAKYPRSSIHSSGIITKILKSKNIQIPSREPPLTSERYLSIASLITGKVIRENSLTKEVIWMVGKRKEDYLVLKKKDHKLLKLKNPTSDTLWLLPSNISSPDPTPHQASGSGTHRDEDAPAPPLSAARHSEASFFSTMQGNYESLHTNYQNLHSSFQGLQNDYHGLHDNYSALYGSYSSMQSDYAVIREDVSQIQRDLRTEQDANSRFRNEVNTYMTERRSADSDMRRMIEGIFSWNLGDSSSRPPPPQ